MSRNFTRAVLAAAAAGAVFALAACAGRGPADVDGARIAAADKEPGNWLSHGRTYAEQRFSPLAQINADNVGELGLAWFADLDTDRGQEATPIVVDGVLYVVDRVEHGQGLRRRDRQAALGLRPEGAAAKSASNACCDVVNRGVAVWKGKVYRRHARRPADRARRGDRQASVGRRDRRPDASPTRSPARRAS